MRAGVEVAILPPNHWQRYANIPCGDVKDAASVWKHKLTPLTVLRSLSVAGDGNQWVHVSVSLPDRLPTWVEITKVKNEFIGEDMEAYQVIAAKKDHVNVHSYCLHLWAPADGRRRVANLQDLTDERAI